MASSQTYKVVKEVFESEQKWVIPNWMQVQQSDERIRNQTFEFQTENSRFESSWMVCFDIIPSSGSYNTIRPLLKLQKLTGLYDQLDTSFGTSLLTAAARSTQCINKVQRTLKAGDVLCTTAGIWTLRIPSVDMTAYSRDGSMTILISLCVHLILSPKDECNNQSLKLLSKDIANLLNDHSLADLTIVTSDDKELKAHKIMLGNRNAVFASMLRPGFFEGSSGVVRIKDITGKTMNILLQYIYTGILLPEWEDDDTIVEFTYAAEKYRLTYVLDMLDQVLGYRTNKNVSFVDVQLLDLAMKTSLKNAESGLFKRIVKAISNVKSAEDFFLIINYEDDKVHVPNSSKAFLAAFEVLNSLLGDADTSEFSEKDFRLLALAKRFTRSDIERKLLQKLKKTVKNLESPADFLKLIEQGSEEEVD